MKKDLQLKLSQSKCGPERSNHKLGIHSKPYKAHQKFKFHQTKLTNHGEKGEGLRTTTKKTRTKKHKKGTVSKIGRHPSEQTEIKGYPHTSHPSNP